MHLLNHLESYKQKYSLRAAELCYVDNDRSVRPNIIYRYQGMLHNTKGGFLHPYDLWLWRNAS